MKTNFKRISKKTLSVVIVAMMVLSTMLVGMVSVSAAYTTSHFYLLGSFTGSNWNSNQTNYPINTAYGSNGKFYIEVTVPSGTSTSNPAYFALYNGTTRYAPATQHTEVSSTGVLGDYNHTDNSWIYTGSASKIRICIDQRDDTSDNQYYPYVWIEEVSSSSSTTSSEVYLFGDYGNGNTWSNKTGGDKLSYDSTNKVYYLNNITFSNPAYFRFYDKTNSKEYGGAGSSNVVVSNDTWISLSTDCQAFVYNSGSTTVNIQVKSDFSQFKVTAASTQTTTAATTTTSGGNTGDTSKWRIVGRFGVKNGDTTTYVGGSLSSWSKEYDKGISMYQYSDNLSYIDTGYTINDLARNTGDNTWYFRFSDGKNIYSTSEDKSLSNTDANTQFTTNLNTGKSFYFTGNDTSGTVVLCLDTSTSTPTFYFRIGSQDEAEKGAYKFTTSSGIGGTVKATNANTALKSGTANQGDTINVTTTTKTGFTYDGITVTYTDTSGQKITENHAESSFELTMPAADVTITATFTVLKDQAYSGNMLWVDTQQSVTTSKIALIKWTNKDGASGNTGSTYTLYLPSGVDLTKLPVYYSFSSLSIDGATIKQGDTYSFADNGTYTVVGDSTTYTLRVYQSTSASIYTVTTEGDLLTSTTGNKTQSKEETGKTLFKNGEFLTVSESGKISNKLMTLSQIKGRGNSSWEASNTLYGKYAYNIKLDSKIDPLGMGATKAKSFCLLANNMDESLLRNVVTYQTALSANLIYTPHFKVADLYNNGEYLGSYLITEKVDVGTSKLVNGETVEDYHNDSSATGNTVQSSFTYNGSTISYQYVDTGSIDNGVDYTQKSYLLEFDLKARAQAENCWFVTPQGQYIALKSPEDLNKEEMLFIIKKWLAAEDAVYNGNYSTASTLMDLDSFANVYLIQEFTKNLDSCATSYYVYYDGRQSSPKWQATPIWDYDWALGGYEGTKNIKTGVTDSDSDATNNLKSTDGWFAKYKCLTYDEDGKEYTSKYNFQSQLANISKFWTNNVKKQWNSGFYTSLLEVFGTTGSTDAYIDTAFTNNLASFTMNETRYHFVAKDLTSSWGSVNTGDTPTAAYESLKKWGIARAAWMNSKLVEDYEVTLVANTSNVAAGDKANFTATVNPSYIDCTYEFYYATQEDLSDAKTKGGEQTSNTFDIETTTPSTYYCYVIAKYAGKEVMSNVVEVTVTVPQTSHNVTIYFKAPTAAAYAPSVKLDNGTSTAMTKDTVLGKTYSGTVTMAWYTITLDNVDSTKSHTLTFKTKRTNLNAKITDKFNANTYYLAVDNIMDGTSVVDLTNEKEYVRNFYHSATNMVYSGLAGDGTLGFTCVTIDGVLTRKAMGSAIEENSTTTSAVSTLSMAANKSTSSVSASSSDGLTIASSTAVQKTIAGITSISELQADLYDVDLNGDLNIKDATLMQMALAGY